MNVYNLFDTQVSSGKTGWEIKIVDSKTGNTTKEINDGSKCSSAYYDDSNNVDSEKVESGTD